MTPSVSRYWLQRHVARWCGQVPADGAAGSDEQPGRRHQVKQCAGDAVGAALPFWGKSRRVSVGVVEEVENGNPPAVRCI